MDSKQVKTLYHGELRTLSPVKVKVVSEILKSTHKKEEYYVKLMLDGRERYLHPENDQCLKFWDGRKGTTITIVADGTHEEATIVMVGHELGEHRQEPTPQPTAPSQQRPAEQAKTEQGESMTQEPKHDQTAAIADAKKFVGRNLSLARIALRGTETLMSEFSARTGVAMSDRMATAVFSSALWGAGQAGIADNLPTKIDINTLLP